MGDKDVQVNISNNSLNAFNQAIKDMQKIYSVVFDNPSFQQIINDSARIEKFAKDVMESYGPVFDQINKQQELIKAFKGINRFDLNSIEVVLPRVDDKKYSEDDVKKFVEEAVAYTSKLINENKGQNVKVFNTFPYKLSEDFQWENITIKFRDRQNVQIVAGDYIYVANYKEMGFEDARKLIPNQQWILLEELSKLKGRISWKDNIANNLIKKKKQLLINALKKYFGINQDPFYPYKNERAYQLKFNIIPENESINQELPEDDDLGIEDSYKDMTSR